MSLGDSCAQRGKSVQPNTLFRCGAEKFIENEQLIVARFEFREQSLDLFPVCAIDQVDSFRLPGQGDLSWTFNLPQINEMPPRPTRYGGLATQNPQTEGSLRW